MPWKVVPDIPAAEQTGFRREFSKSASFLIDHNVDAAIAAAVRHEGWNVRTVKEVALARQEDENVLALAWREDRVLISHDRDFLDERRFPPHRNPSVVILPGGSGDLDSAVAALSDFLVLLAPYRELLRHATVEAATGHTFSIRARNADSGVRETTRYRYTNDGFEQWVDG